MRKFLSIKRMRVQHTNSMISYNAVGAPAITAHVGFADAIAHRFKLESSGIAILHHGQDHEGIKSYGRLAPNRVRGVPLQISSKKPSNMLLSDQPFAVSHYEASFIIALSGDDFDDFDGAVEQGELENILLSKFRLAGGVIVNLGGVAVFDNLKQAKNYLPKTGHWVLDRKDILENRNENQDVLSAAISALYPQEDIKTEKSKVKKELEILDKSWLSMSVVGFIRVSEFEKREGVRQDLPHAFVEPMLGVIEYKNIRKISSVEEKQIFWAFAQISEDSYVTIAQKNNF